VFSAADVYDTQEKEQGQGRTGGEVHREEDAVEGEVGHRGGGVPLLPLLVHEDEELLLPFGVRTDVVERPR
jgi:hypothetical protein